MARIESQLLSAVHRELLPGKVYKCTPRTVLRTLIKISVLDTVMDDADRIMRNKMHKVLDAVLIMTELPTQILKYEDLQRSINMFISDRILVTTPNLTSTVSVTVKIKAERMERAA